MNFKVEGGRIIFRDLTNKIDQRKFAIKKAIIWLEMLNDGMKPVKWLKAGGKGTNVDFLQLHSEKEYKEEITELEKFIKRTNEKFLTNLSLYENAKKEVIKK